MVGLVAWLLEQVAEDERLARACIAEVGPERAGEMYVDGSGTTDRDSFPSYPWGSEKLELAFMAGPGHPARVLADCAVKRRIIGLVQLDFNEDGDPIRLGEYGEAYWDMVLLLAVLYAGRPGYREEWTP